MNHIPEDMLDMEAIDLDPTEQPAVGPEAVGQLTDVPFCESTPVPPPSPPGGRANMGRKRKRHKAKTVSDSAEEGTEE